MATVIKRQTKYCDAVQQTLYRLGHATNATLLSELHKSYPNLSATTVHRITARLLKRGDIGIAPPDRDGSMRYDANISSHDHFQCSSCGQLRDANIRDIIVPIIESSLDGCSVSGRLTITGVCKKCMEGD
jgi:Fur family peroxide stress response transcriptional regulator